MCQCGVPLRCTAGGTCCSAANNIAATETLLRLLELCCQEPSVKPSAETLSCSAQVVGEDVVSPDADALHSFLLAALLAPHSLGVPASEEDTARTMAGAAKLRPCPSLSPTL